MAERRKRDLAPEGVSDGQASRPSGEPPRDGSLEAKMASADPATLDEGRPETPEKLAARAAEELLTPPGLPSGTARPHDAIVLTGFLGASGRTGRRRLYLEATLKDYVEIPDADIRHLEWVGTEQSIFGRKASLWIRHGAQIEYTTARS